MDHKEKHHQHHQKEREHEKKEQKAFESKQSKYPLPFHPKWFIFVGIPLIVLAVIVWTFLIW